jgi:glycosyltransferase involved in cell wall biosynthesis
MSAPLVSILIPCHNAAPWLAATLESALAQTWAEKEIIVVDDGSTDPSLEIARRFEPRGIRVITQANAGASAARNAAWRASRGAWLQFLDADDLLEPGKIAHQLAGAGAAETGAALCGTWNRFQAVPGDLPPVAQPLSADLPAVEWMILKFEHNLMMHPAAWLTSRALAEQAGPWDESLSLDDDGEFFSRVVLASTGVRCCRAAVSHYRSGLPGSLSRSRSERAWASAHRSLAQSAARLLQREDSPRTRHACATVLQRYIHEAYPRAAACRRLAAAEVARLGGSDLAPEGGPQFQFWRRCVGWRLARRLQLLLSR